MRRLLLTILSVLTVLLVAAIAYGAWKNPEKTTLDATARAKSPGKFIALSRGTTHYEMAGPDSGRLVVLVHGFSVPSYIWDSTVVGLKNAGYRVLRYDLYGRGVSDRPNGDYDGALYDGQLGDLLDSLRITEPVDLVGLSFGGFVTAHYVASHPSRVRTLTLVDPVSQKSGLPRVLGLPVIGPWLWQVMYVPGMADNQRTDFLHPEHYPTWADQYRPQMRYNGFGHALLSTAILLSRTDFDALYAGVAHTGVPVMLIWGKQDQTVPLPLSVVVRRNIPSVEFVAVDSAGHLPHIEQARLVNARLSAFLEATAGPVTALRTLREHLRALDSELPMVESTFTERFHDSLADPRRWTGVLSAFAAAGVALAGLGIFGLMSYVVRQRRREIGVRLALGAQPASVSRLIVARGMRYATVGSAIGLAATLVLANRIKTLLFEVTPTDGLTIAAVSALLLVVAFMACWLPGRRAARIRPLEAISTE